MAGSKLPFPTLTSTVLFLLGLSGCISDSPGEIQATTAGVQLSWQVPGLPQLDAKLMLAEHKAFVKKFPIRRENVETHKQARDFLAQELGDAGLQVWRHEFTKEIPQQNICGVQLGVGAPEEWVVVGAHYDTFSNNARALANSYIRRVTNLTGDPRNDTIPETAIDQLVFDRISEGAYDDGSGTRMVVDLAKKFSRSPSYYSIVYCLFDGEERGLQGSQAFKSAMDDGAFPWPVLDTRAMIDLDMIGLNWPIRAPIVVDHNNYKFVAEVEKIRKQLKIPDGMIEYGPDELEVASYRRPLGQSDYRWWYVTETPTLFFISDFAKMAPPIPGGQPAITHPLVGTVNVWTPGVYPFWHLGDTYENMETWAGGPDMLQAGFQTALDLSAGVLSVAAYQPGIDLTR